MKTEQKTHWETVYSTKLPHEVSWTQEKPETSLNFIHALAKSKSDSIIDIGGGDSLLVDFLLEEGYTNLTVLDISANSLKRAQTRLGENAKFVHWIESDITEFKPNQTYDVWHDRATFHFLTEPVQIEIYKNLVQNSVEGSMIMATFSENGPLKCSGLEIKQYTAESMSKVFENSFQLHETTHIDHTTPFETTQNFVFCTFRKK